MKQSKEREMVHNGCPYRHSCAKDETKCCYLVNNRCIINEFQDNYLFKSKRDRIF